MSHPKLKVFIYINPHLTIFPLKEPYILYEGLMFIEILAADLEKYTNDYVKGELISHINASEIKAKHANYLGEEHFLGYPNKHLIYRIRIVHNNPETAERQSLFYAIYNQPKKNRPLPPQKGDFGIVYFETQSKKPVERTYPKFVTIEAYKETVNYLTQIPGNSDHAFEVLLPKNGDFVDHSAGLNAEIHPLRTLIKYARKQAPRSGSDFHVIMDIATHILEWQGKPFSDINRLRREHLI